MKRYIARRLLQFIPVIFLTALIVFVVFRLIPGDPAVLILGQDATPEKLAVLREKMGLGDPIPVQFGIWILDVIRGDFGESYIDHKPAIDLILEKLPNTLELAIFSSVFALLIAIPIGILSAMKPGSILDSIARLFTTIGFSFPHYVTALLLVLLFSVQLRVLPSAGFSTLTEDWRANLRYILLPGITLGLANSAVFIRFLRASLLEVFSQNYIRTAKSKGLMERDVILRHAMKNALIPFITIVSLSFGGLMGGAVVVEQIFSWPGIGWLSVQSVALRDYAVLQGIILMIAVGFLVINLTVDILYAYLDPRIRYE
jgi:peptide/nickel transport system permease protein